MTDKTTSSPASTGASTSRRDWLTLLLIPFCLLLAFTGGPAIDPTNRGSDLEKSFGFWGPVLFFAPIAILGLLVWLAVTLIN